MEMMGDDLEDVDKNRSNGAVPWDDLQGSGTYSYSVRKQKLHVDRDDVEDPGGVSSPSGQKRCRDDGETCSGQDV